MYRFHRLLPALLLMGLMTYGFGEEKAGDLFRLMEEYQAFEVEKDPLEATQRGHNQHNDKLPSRTLESYERELDFTRKIIKRLQQIDRTSLSRENRINYDIFHYKLKDKTSKIRYGRYLMPLKSDMGFHIGFAMMPGSMPLKTVKDYEDYIARMNAWPRFVGENIALLQKGLDTGYIIPKVVLNGYEVTIETHVVENPKESVFYEPFTRIPTSFAQEDRARLEKDGLEAITKSIIKGYNDFLTFMTETYMPKARDGIGLFELPEGKEHYADRVRHFTTLNMTPEEVHQVGLVEVARIRKEMQEIIDQVGFEGDFPAFLDFLRTDPRFYAKTPQELMMKASFYAKSMDAKLPSLFKTLPRQPYGVEPVPDHLAPKYTGGRYVSAPLKSKRAGTYWVNTYDLKSRPLYILEALTLHEAVPGHHLQIALSAELDLHPIRRGFYISAFGEGWGLYSEWLGLEAGFYKDPYSNFGRLTYEMWRACRLVVDTGIHHMGWSRQKVMDYMAANTALSRHEITTETDRYIGWPGQALSYKIGEIKIRELRKLAEKELGEAFDIRQFHEVVLRNGAILLETLEEEVKRYIEETKS